MGAIGNFGQASPVARDAYLGVTASVRGLAWRDRLDAAAAKIAAAICQRHGLPELLGRVLASRQVRLEEVEAALNPTLRALMPDPSSMRDMDKGAVRLADAIVQKQPSTAPAGRQRCSTSEPPTHARRAFTYRTA
jgi:single-stranded-DNA-specific exonuclease